MAASRSLLAGLVLALVWALSGRPGPAGRFVWLPPVLFGLVNGTGVALLFWGGQHIASGQSAVLIGTVPLFTMLVGFWWFGEPFSWPRLAAVAVGLLGVTLAVTQTAGPGFADSQEMRVLGQVAVLGTALGYAISYSVAKRSFRGALLPNTAVHLTVSGLWLLLLSLMLDPPVTEAVLTAAALWPVVYLAVLASAVAFWCQAFLLVHLPSAQATYPSLINPPVAAILGGAFLGESLTALNATGILLVVIGAWLVIAPENQGALPRRRSAPGLSSLESRR